jgi:hypothetical protein
MQAPWPSMSARGTLCAAHSAAAAATDGWGAGSGCAMRKEWRPAGWPCGGLSNGDGGGCGSGVEKSGLCSSCWADGSALLRVGLDRGEGEERPLRCGSLTCQTAPSGRASTAADVVVVVVVVLDAGCRAAAAATAGAGAASACVAPAVAPCARLRSARPASKPPPSRRRVVQQQQQQQQRKASLCPLSHDLPKANMRRLSCGAACLVLLLPPPLPPLLLLQLLLPPLPLPLLRWLWWWWSCRV